MSWVLTAAHWKFKVFIQWICFHLSWKEKSVLEWDNWLIPTERCSASHIEGCEGSEGSMVGKQDVLKSPFVNLVYSQGLEEKWY